VLELEANHRRCGSPTQGPFTNKYSFPGLPWRCVLSPASPSPKAPARGARRAPGMGSGYCQEARPPPSSLGVFSGEGAWIVGRGGGGGKSRLVWEAGGALSCAATRSCKPQAVRSHPALLTTHRASCTRRTPFSQSALVYFCVTISISTASFFLLSRSHSSLAQQVAYVWTNLFGLTYLLAYVLVCQAAGTAHTGGARRPTPHRNGPLTGRTAGRLAGSGPHPGAVIYFITVSSVEARLSTEELQRYLAVDLFLCPPTTPWWWRYLEQSSFRCWLWTRGP
jgi:hypothetical protein